MAALATILFRGVVVGSKATAFMMNLLQVVRDHWVHVLVPMGFVFGYYLDRKNDEKLTAFRNKSLLYKRELKPNEEVTWNNGYSWITECSHFLNHKRNKNTHYLIWRKKKEWEKKNKNMQ